MPLYTEDGQPYGAVAQAPQAMFDPAGAVEPLKKPEKLGVIEVLGAAARQDNAVVNLIDAVTKPEFTPDPLYTTEKLKQRDEFRQSPNSFVGVQSAQEEEAVVNRIRAEQKDRETLAAAGWGGTLAGVTMGALDPTLLMPATWALKGAKAANTARGAASGALLTGAAVAAQEGALQSNQELRSGEESALAIGGATLLGGLLGGAVGYMTREEFQSLARAIETEPGVAISQGERAVPGAVGAAPAEAVDVRGLAPAVGGKAVQTALAESSPALRVQVGESVANLPAASQTMAVITDGGVRLDGVVPGGTIENRVQFSQAGLYQAATETDQIYARLWFGDNVPKFAARIRSRVGSEAASYMGSLNGRYSASDFRKEVSRALAEEKPHQVAEVNEAAVSYKKNVYDPLWEQWKKVNEDWGREPVEKEFKAYVNRIYLHEEVVKRRPEFVQKLSQHFEPKLREAYTKSKAALDAAKARGAEEKMDLTLDPLSRAFTIEALEKERLADKESPSAKLLERLKEEEKTARDSGDQTLIAAQKANAEATKTAAGPEFAAYRDKQKVISRRLSKLKFGGFETRQRIAIEKAEALQDTMVKSTERMVEKITRLLSDLTKLDDDVLDEKLVAARNRLEKLLEQFDRAEARLAKTVGAGEAEALAQRTDALKTRITDAVTYLSVREGFDREVAREALGEAADAAVRNLNDLNATRAVRLQKYYDEAAAATPEAVTAKAAKVDERLHRRADAFAERWRPKFDDLEAPDFAKAAKLTAEEITDKILGDSGQRLAGFDMMNGQRGAELARTLDIPDREIESFLERDVEKLAQIYTRTLAPDIELVRRFGTVGLEEQFAKVKDDYDAWRGRIEASDKSPETKAKEFLKADKVYNDAIRDIRVSVERIRHQHALPDNPQGLGHRLASTALSINYLRLMGGMTLSSIPDAARPVMKFGVLSTFGDGFRPMVTNLPLYNGLREQVKDMSVGLDLVLDTRTQLLSDIYQNWQSRTKAEKVVEFATNKMGLVSLMAPWNAAMKQFTGVITLSHALRAIEATAAGKVTKKQLQFLEENGINSRIALAIWEEMQAGGATKIDGTWLPETAVWKNDEARRALSAAVVRVTNNQIVTPGLERPIFIQGGKDTWLSPDVAKILFQFKSFGFASITKMLMAGMQQNDIALYNGIMLAVALGSLSWWAKSVSAGGKKEEEMRKAGPARWAAEGIDASGIIPLFSDMNKIMERTPLGGVSNFTGQEISKTQGTDLLEAVIGPTGGLISTTGRVAQGFGKGPAQGDVHALRSLAAYQNLFYLRQGFDKIEDNINAKFGIPKRRPEQSK